MLDYFYTTAEYTRWGQSEFMFVVTMTFILTSVVFWYGARNQFLKITREGRLRGTAGQSVSTKWITYFVFLALNVAIYGFYIGSLAILYNGLVLMVGSSLVLIALYQYKSVSRFEVILLSVFAVLPLVTIATPMSFKQEMFFIGHVGGLCLGLTQPYEVWKNKTMGSLDWRFIATLLANSSFWFLYGLITSDWAVTAIGGGYASIYLTTLILCATLKTPRVL
jgi:hypothetical protein